MIMPPCTCDCLCCKPKPDQEESKPIDLTNWKLTLPSGKKGSPQEVLQPALKDFTNEYFYIDSAKSCTVFKANCGGFTTSGSSYPRSELREMNGKALAAWDLSKGVHKMTWTAAITNIPVVKPQVVVGQIHDSQDDVFFIRLSKNILEVVHDSAKYGVLDSNYILGTKYKMSITVTNGSVSVTYNDTKTVNFKPKPSKTNYFKLGMYTQSNPSKGDKPDAFGQVEIYECSVEHK